MAESEAEGRVAPSAQVIGPAMFDGTGHDLALGRQVGTVGRIQESCNTAHGVKFIGLSVVSWKIDERLHEIF